MDKKDVFILNRALDGRQIYGMPDFANMNFSNLLIDVYKEGMIRRGILADKGNLTLKGARIVSCIKEYKESDKYITINNIVIGKNDDGKVVTLIHNPLYDEYKFVRNKLVDNYDILESYSFLKDVEECERKVVMEMNPREFKANYGNIKKDILYLTIYDKNIEKMFVIFVKQGKAYFYDKNASCLYNVGRKEIIDLIKGGLQ